MELRPIQEAMHRLTISIEKLDQFERKALPRIKNQYHVIIMDGLAQLINAKVLKKKVKKFNSDELSDKIRQLSQRIVALKARLDSARGSGLPSNSLSDNLFKEVLEIAYNWKINLPLNPDRLFGERDLAAIEEACRYPKFAKCLLKDEALRVAFFKWAIRDRNNVEVFVKFPAYAKRLKECLLTGRIGRFGGKDLALREQNGYQVLTLPFFDGHQVKQVNILNENNVVSLSHGLRLTVKKVLEVFARKNIEVGNLEFFAEKGICNWNVQQMGSWNPSTESFDCIDLEATNWIDQLPILQNVSKSEIENLYGICLKPGEWVAGPKASRGAPFLDIQDTHGYLEFAKPLDDGSYAIYCMTRFPINFPQGIVENLNFLGNTVRARIAYPDENTYYSHRQQAFVPFILSPQQGSEMLELIRQDLKIARSGNLIFQYAWESCAHWAESIFDRLFKGQLPSFYRIPIFDCTPSNPMMGAIFSFAKLFSKRIQPYCVSIMEVMLRTGRGVEITENGKRVFKSLANSPFKQLREIFHPAQLHRQIERGTLKGKITYGHR